jgi:hypothetical protein
MSRNYSIQFKLNAFYNETNIQKILQRGLENGFKYYDHIWGEKYEDAPILDAKRATEKVMKSLYDEMDGGPCVYTTFQKESVAFLWFYKSEEGGLEFHVGGFGGIRKKEHYMDFSYYVKFFLDLCEDFTILELKTTIEE